MSFSTDFKRDSIALATRSVGRSFLCLPPHDLLCCDESQGGYRRSGRHPHYVWREMTTLRKVAVYSPPHGTMFVMTSGLRSLRDKTLTYFENA